MKEGELEIRLFDDKICQNVPKTIFYMSILYAVFVIPGAFKIHKRI